MTAVVLATIGLQRLTEVEGMALIVPDDELARPPGGLVQGRDEGDPASGQPLRVGRRIVALEVEVEVTAPIHEVDRRIFLVGELEMEDLTARPDARVEVLVLEIQREADLLDIEADRSGEIRRPELRDITTKVMPICTANKKWLGVLASSKAVFAFLLPLPVQS